MVNLLPVARTRMRCSELLHEYVGRSPWLLQSAKSKLAHVVADLLCLLARQRRKGATGETCTTHTELKCFCVFSHLV